MDALFIYSHIDDETICSYGFINKLIDSKANVTIAIACGQSNKNGQIQAIREIYSNTNIKIKFGSYLNVSTSKNDMKMFVENQLLNNAYDIVVSHSMNDLHYEHRLLSEEVLVASRTKHIKNVRCLLFASACMNQWAYGQFGQFQPNLFVDISTYATSKESALMKYSSIGLLPNDPYDLRSPNAIMKSNMSSGAVSGVAYAEAYQQVFCIR